MQQSQLVWYRETPLTPKAKPSQILAPLQPLLTRESITFTHGAQQVEKGKWVKVNSVNLAKVWLLGEYWEKGGTDTVGIKHFHQ